MQTLANLKSRLEALPAIREGRQHEARYAGFLNSCTSAKQKLEKASCAITQATLVLPAPGYNDALKTVKTGGKIAFRLRDRLVVEPGAVVDSKIEDSFTRLSDNADSALKFCQTAWESQLQAKIRDWEAIAEVVAKLGEGEEAKAMKMQAKRLKSAIDSLRAAKSKLPQIKQDAVRIQNDLKDLNESVSKLGLDTPFGKFLQEAASPQGADLNTTQQDEVANLIKKHSLEKVFRVRVSF